MQESNFQTCSGTRLKRVLKMGECRNITGFSALFFVFFLALTMSFDRCTAQNENKFSKRKY